MFDQYPQHLLSVVSYFAAFSILTLITVYIFSLITKYNDWEEIQKGNVAAAMALSGKVFGVGNIVHFAILSNDNFSQTALWGCTGMVLLLLVYLAFELVTPRLNVNEEIRKDNRAVGLFSMIISITFSFIIGASIA